MTTLTLDARFLNVIIVNFASSHQKSTFNFASFRSLAIWARSPCKLTLAINWSSCEVSQAQGRSLNLVARTHVGAPPKLLSWFFFKCQKNELTWSVAQSEFLSRRRFFCYQFTTSSRVALSRRLDES